MIMVTAAKGKNLCTNCEKHIATTKVANRFLLCENCARALLENLKRKEETENANPI